MLCKSKCHVLLIEGDIQARETCWGKGESCMREYDWKLKQKSQARLGNAKYARAHDTPHYVTDVNRLVGRAACRVAFRSWDWSKRFLGSISLFQPASQFALNNMNSSSILKECCTSSAKPEEHGTSSVKPEKKEDVMVQKGAPVAKPTDDIEPRVTIRATTPVQSKSQGTISTLADVRKLSWLLPHVSYSWWSIYVGLST